MTAAAELIQAFLKETFEDSPVLASQLGIDGHDDQLDDLSEAAIDDRRRRSAAWLTRFEQLLDKLGPFLPEYDTMWRAPGSPGRRYCMQQFNDVYPQMRTHMPGLWKIVMVIFEQFYDGSLDRVLVEWIH